MPSAGPRGRPSGGLRGSGPSGRDHRSDSYGPARSGTRQGRRFPPPSRRRALEVRMKTLFPDDQVVGVFRGFLEGGLEFHADLVLRYRSDLQTIPMHGQFVVVQLEKETEGV